MSFNRQPAPRTLGLLRQMTRRLRAALSEQPRRKKWLRPALSFESLQERLTPSTTDGIGIFRPDTAEFAFNTSELTDFNSREFFTITFGNAGDQGYVGDFTGNGIPNVGIRRGETFFINTSSINAFDSAAYVSVRIGLDTDQVLIGDWDGDQVDDIGLYRAELATYVAIDIPVLNTGQRGTITASNIRNITYGSGQADPDSGPILPAVGHVIEDYFGDQIGYQTDGFIFIADIDITQLTAGNTSVTETVTMNPSVFGVAGDAPLLGQWVEGEIDQRGLYRSSSITYSFSSLNSSSVQFGLTGDVGIRGRWIGLSGSSATLLESPLDEGLVDSFFDLEEEE
ncbi:hypothetical protein Pan216_21540 [Planctomycetes bacterium Pan216]|uniref:FG-GAP repeat protein n=1 Tax=Kolteria novifilia TaxID=2527975 RepID=A0A518B2T8_9BACT|nr:hypothetical protein Pan216_21540 [Planctomycetes bacterium Pan216]